MKHNRISGLFAVLLCLIMLLILPLSAFAAYTVRDGISADLSDLTNIYGYVRFDDLQKGLYLVIGEMFIDGDTVYNPLPFGRKPKRIM